MMSPVCVCKHWLFHLGLANSICILHYSFYRPDHNEVYGVLNSRVIWEYRETERKGRRKRERERKKERERGKEGEREREREREGERERGRGGGGGRGWVL